MGPLDFFDIANRYAGLDAKNDPLVKIDDVVRRKEFRPALELVWRAAPHTRKSAAGRKPWDAALDNPCQGGSLVIVQLRWIARRLAADQPRRAAGVETQPPFVGETVHWTVS